MNVWKVTDADRTPDGRIWVTPPARTLADLLPATAPAPEEGTPRPPWRLGRAELASIAAGLVLLVALVAALRTFTTASPAPRAMPTAQPTVQPTLAPTIAPTVQPTVAMPTLEPPPAAAPAPAPEPPAPVVIYQEPPCDVSVNPRYVVTIDLSPIGSATGVSCSSQEEAQANADAQAAQVLAGATLPTEPPAPSPLPPLLVGETLAEYFARTGVTPETAKP